MKTSNKILFGILAFGFGLLITAQAALHAMYSRDKYLTPEEYEAIFYKQYMPTGIKHVYLYDIAECHILPAGAVKLSVQKNGASYIQYNITGDTLNVLGVYKEAHLNNKRLYASSQDVRVYIPPGIDVRAANSNIDLRGNMAGSKPQSYQFKLNNSALYTRERSYKDSINRYFDTISVNASNYSTIALYEKEQINILSLVLDSSEIEDRFARVGHINLTADKKSTIVLSGGNFKNLNGAIIK